MKRLAMILLTLAAAAGLGAFDEFHDVNPELVQAARYRILQKVTGAKAKGSTTAAKPPGVTGLPSKGSPKVLVMPIEFSDASHKPESSVAYLREKFFSTDPTKTSLRNFYYRSSFGQLDVGGTVLPWFRLNKTWSTFEAEKGIDAAIEQILQHYVTVGGIHLKQFDNDDDSRIDAIIVIYAQHPDMKSFRGGFWWAYAGGTYLGGDMDQNFRTYLPVPVPGRWIPLKEPRPPQTPRDLTNIGLGLRSYVFAPEASGLSLWCHEFGHLLGLPDLYDGSDEGPGGGVGGLDLMDSNAYDMNCFSKFLLDWIQPEVVSTTTKNIILERASDPAVPTDQKAILVCPSVNGATNPLINDFFMVEHRGPDGTDTDMPGDDSDLPGEGLLIWHVDARLNAAQNGFLFNNWTTEHKLIRLMEADGREDIEEYKAGDRGDFYKAGDVFGIDTVPNSNLYSGSPSWIGVSNIIYPTGKAADAIAFDVCLDQSAAPGGTPSAPIPIATTKLDTCEFDLYPPQGVGGYIPDPESGIGGFIYELSIIGPGKIIAKHATAASSKLATTVLLEDVPESYRQIYEDQVPVFARVAILNGAGSQSDWSSWSSAVYVKFPRIISFSPTAAKVGWTLSVHGANLNASQKIIFAGGASADLTATDTTGTNYSVVVPVGAGSGKIKVAVPTDTGLVPVSSSLDLLYVVSDQSILDLNNSPSWQLAFPSGGSASIEGTRGNTIQVKFGPTTDYVTMTSLPLSSWPRTIPNQFTVSVRIASNESWGGINLFLNSMTSTPNLYNAYAGYASIQGFKPDEWHDITWTLTDDQVQSLAKGFSDLTLTFTINFAKGSSMEFRKPR